MHGLASAGQACRHLTVVLAGAQIEMKGRVRLEHLAHFLEQLQGSRSRTVSLAVARHALRQLKPCFNSLIAPQLNTAGALHAPESPAS